MTYIIMTNPKIPRYVPAGRLRRVAEFLRIAPRRTMIFAAANNTLWCNPQSVESLIKYLNSRGMQYVIGKPKTAAPRMQLHAVPSPPSGAGRSDVH